MPTPLRAFNALVLFCVLAKRADEKWRAAFRNPLSTRAQLALASCTCESPSTAVLACCSSEPTMMTKCRKVDQPSADELHLAITS